MKVYVAIDKEFLKRIQEGNEGVWAAYISAKGGWPESLVSFPLEIPDPPKPWEKEKFICDEGNVCEVQKCLNSTCHRRNCRLETLIIKPKEEG